MPVENHALLSASSAHRWLYCPMLPRLEAEYPSRDTVYTQEGTAAHELSEIKLMYKSGKIKKREFNKRLKEFKESTDYYNEEMEEMTELYTDIVMEHFNSYDSAEIELEKRVDFSEWVPNGFGTSDAVILSDGVIEIIDLKYGKGMPVSAKQNPQMGLYALGAYATYDMIYDFDKIRMTIVQPRLDSVSTVEIFVEELLYWADNVVLPMAAQADAGIGDWDLNEKVLQWSPVAAKLVPRAQANWELIDRYELQEPIYLDGEAIAEILDRASEFKKWIESVEAYALKQALAGEEVPGYKVVEGRSNRVITDKDKAVDILHDNGFDDEIYKPKELLAMGALEKLIGKSTFTELLAEVIDKPQGKPVLVPNSDKRPAMNSLEQAIKDFE
ncbi:DUF2800 domain-containing protein [Streptococcus cuniculi]|uniref:DUF2800 domain-containing protein n=1 Tax=Streptococcus cuniculi TaxID=1432788 RepID=A0A4Y9JDI2_9STRE|nr:DUF2800 domain-containing protein [Streptococcus cuniculi]MBF0778153.1 DUF2800 domain-containing protein [Streptococcus cuniculi]TFU97895.1 DUF2800 domain-containing protein [Streptococcus cuniculi]